MAIPLFWRFIGTAALPRVALCDLPTPVEALDEVAAEYGIGTLLVKRDDRTSRSYGGNKVRKLEFLLGEAMDHEQQAVITFGAYGSNHALATAVHARAVGLEPHVVLSPQAPTPYARATLLAHAALGTHIHLAEGWDGTRQAASARRQLEEANGVQPLVVPMGGTNAVGAAGYVNAAFELVDQVVDDDMLEYETEIELPDRVLPPDRVYVAAGTLGTAVGLAIGFAVEDPDTRVVAVRVTPSQVADESFARALADQIVDLLRSMDPEFPGLAYDDLNLELRHDWFEPGYGVVTPESLAAVARAADVGLALETTYTGKAFAAMLADAREGLLAESDVTFWNTYNSAPMPAPGDVRELPQQLQDYVAECDRLFGKQETPSAAMTEGDRE